MTVGDLNRSFSFRVLVMIRGELTIVASDSVKAEKGDILIVESDRLKKKHTKIKKQRAPQ